MNKIILGDAVHSMKNIESSSIDLAITSPPYNMKDKCKKWGDYNGRALKISTAYDANEDCLTRNKYVSWQRECLSEMMRIIKDDGAIFYNQKWRVREGILMDCSDIVKDFPVRQIIIWDRSSGTNFCQRYFLPTYEVIYMITKRDFKLRKKANSFKDVWRITTERNPNHPAPFPLEIPDRILKSTYAKSVIDPFSGSGTTACAAIKNGINYIGIEKSEKYRKDSISRIKLFRSKYEGTSITDNNHDARGQYRLFQSTKLE